MSENTLAVAMRTIGIPKEKMSIHGWRSTGRTNLDEELHFPPHLIEYQLGHTVRDPLGRAYNRTTHLPPGAPPHDAAVGGLAGQNTHRDDGLNTPHSCTPPVPGTKCF